MSDTEEPLLNVRGIVVCVSTEGRFERVSIQCDVLQFTGKEGETCLELFEEGDKVAEFREWAWFAKRENVDASGEWVSYE